MEYSIQQLFTQYLKGQCTSMEIESLMAYFNNPENELLLKQLIIAEIELAGNDQNNMPDLDARLGNIQNNVQQYISQDRATGKLWRKWMSVAAAAAILLIAGIALVYYNQKEQPTVLIVSSVKNISPGKKSATLTLANGSKILLNDATRGEVAKQGGVSITKTADGKIAYNAIVNAVNSSKNGAIAYDKLSTANGEQYSITLPDGSVITLNAASSIKYPASFASLKERRIELTGEAYFEVKHNSKQPFRVVSKGQYVEDIGTEFNINSYTDEQDVKTTLVSGSARVSSGSTSGINLMPNQQAIYSGNSLSVNTVDPGIFIAWKNGLFAYKNTSLQAVMRQVARWYNVEIVYQDEELRAKRLTGSVSRYDTVSGILNAIGYTAKVRFKVDNRTITILQAD